MKRKKKKKDCTTFLCLESKARGLLLLKTRYGNGIFACISNHTTLNPGLMSLMVSFSSKVYSKSSIGHRVIGNDISIMLMTAMNLIREKKNLPFFLREAVFCVFFLTNDS